MPGVACNTSAGMMANSNGSGGKACGCGLQLYRCDTGARSPFYITPSGTPPTAVQYGAGCYTVGTFVDGTQLVPDSAYVVLSNGCSNSSCGSCPAANASTCTIGNFSTMHLSFGWPPGLGGSSYFEIDAILPVGPATGPLSCTTGGGFGLYYIGGCYFCGVATFTEYSSTDNSIIRQYPTWLHVAFTTPSGGACATASRVVYIDIQTVIYWGELYDEPYEFSGDGGVTATAPSTGASMSTTNATLTMSGPQWPNSGGGNVPGYIDYTVTF